MITREALRLIESQRSYIGDCNYKFKSRDNRKKRKSGGYNAHKIDLLLSSIERRLKASEKIYWSDFRTDHLSNKDDSEFRVTSSTYAYDAGEVRNFLNQLQKMLQGADGRGYKHYVHDVPVKAPPRKTALGDWKDGWRFDGTDWVPSAEYRHYRNPDGTPTSRLWNGEWTNVVQGDQAKHKRWLKILVPLSVVALIVTLVTILPLVSSGDPLSVGFSPILKVLGSFAVTVFLLKKVSFRRFLASEAQKKYAALPTLPTEPTTKPKPPIIP